MDKSTTATSSSSATPNNNSLLEIPSPPPPDPPKQDRYAQMLWGSSSPSSPSSLPDHSASLDYVREHGAQMIDRVLKEDPHLRYVATKQVQDVRLFRILPNEAQELARPVDVRGARCEFRGVTRVPGSVDAVMEMLAADNEREAYWVALNTQKGLRTSTLFASRRLSPTAAFPRWNQKYVATKFSKNSTKPVDYCYTEYATYANDPKSDLQRAFVYRRSMDGNIFSMESIKVKLAKYGDETYERMYIEDWLFEVSETKERHICKLVLTASVYFPGEHSSVFRDDFQDYCTQMLMLTRNVLSKQWKDQVENAGVNSTSRLSMALTNQPAGQSRCCGVCSTTFTLLRKRYPCHTCGIVVCSKCCTKTSRSGSSSVSSLLMPSSQNNQRRKSIECMLCNQFGSNGSISRVSVNIRRHFTSSMSSVKSISTSTLQLDEELDDFSDVGSRRGDVYSVTSSMCSSNQDEEDVHTFTPRIDLQRKNRTESNDSTRSTKSAPGVVLISELESLSLTGSFRSVSSIDYTNNPTTAKMSKRQFRAASEDNVLFTNTTQDEEYSEDDLANFNLKLL